MAAVVHPNNRSRTASGNNNGKNEFSYQIVLEATDTDSDDDSRESVFSIQAETTVSAKDSSDLSTNDDMSDYFSEFELASSPEGWPHPWSFDRDISSENSPHQLNDIDTALKLPVAESSEIGSSGNDNEDAESSESAESGGSGSDVSVSNCRFEHCAMCSCVNVNSLFQFCHSCYQIKKKFFWEKPPTRKKRKRTAMDSINSVERIKRRKASPSPDGARTDSSSQGTSGIGSGTSGFESLNSQNSVDSNDAPMLASVPAHYSAFKNSDAEDGDEKCLACFQNSTNALFVHGKTGHLFCCYSCAKRIWFESRRCPICRSKVSNIIRILNP